MAHQFRSRVIDWTSETTCYSKWAVFQLMKLALDRLVVLLKYGLLLLSAQAHLVHSLFEGLAERSLQIDIIMIEFSTSLILHSSLLSDLTGCHRLLVHGVLNNCRCSISVSTTVLWLMRES